MPDEPRRESSSGDGRVPLGFGRLSTCPGDHIGHFYETPKERTSILVSYFVAGLEAGDKCGCLISPASKPELECGLAEAAVDVKRVAKSGQLMIHEGADDPETLKVLLAEVLSDVPERYPLLRWAGDMTWSLGKMPTSERLMEWESHCNVLEHPPAIFLCQYDLTAFRGNVVMDALKTHPTCVVSNVIHQNPYYQDPEQFLDELRARRPTTLAV